MTALARYIPAEVSASDIARGDVLSGFAVREVVSWEQDGATWLDVHTADGLVRTFAPSSLVSVRRRVVEEP